MASESYDRECPLIRAMRKRDLCVMWRDVEETAPPNPGPLGSVKLEGCVLVAAGFQALQQMAIVRLVQHPGAQDGLHRVI